MNRLKKLKDQIISLIQIGHFILMISFLMNYLKKKNNNYLIKLKIP